MRISFIRYIVTIALALTAAGAVADLFNEASDAFNTMASFPEAGEYRSR